MAATWNTGRLALVAVIGHVCGLCFYVDYAPCVAPMAWTVLPLSCSMLASMAWTMWFFYGLNYAFAYACFFGTSMGHNTWYLVLCNEFSQEHGCEHDRSTEILKLTIYISLVLQTDTIRIPTHQRIDAASGNKRVGLRPSTF
jgi:hypothetical protein